MFSCEFCKIFKKVFITEKETLAQVFFCEFCEISYSTIFTEHLQKSASEQRSWTKS